MVSSARLVMALLAAAGLLLLGGQGAAARQATSEISVPAPEAPDTGPLVAPGDPPDLTLLYTGGVVGYIEPCG